jgi:hypothetical protein
MIRALWGPGWPRRLGRADLRQREEEVVDLRRPCELRWLVDDLVDPRPPRGELLLQPCPSDPDLIRLPQGTHPLIEGSPRSRVARLSRHGRILGDPSLTRRPFLKIPCHSTDRGGHASPGPEAWYARKTEFAHPTAQVELGSGARFLAGEEQLLVLCARLSTGGASGLPDVKLHPQVARPAKLATGASVSNDRRRDRCVSLARHLVPGLFGVTWTLSRVFGSKRQSGQTALARSTRRCSKP